MSGKHFELFNNAGIKPSTACALLVCFVLTACKRDFREPVVSFDHYRIAEGFEMRLAASEPLIEAPVTMDFDNQGRMWVVEMRGFMPDVRGRGDEAPTGRITILEDLDEDGVADHARVFLDSLLLPRAIAHVYGGLLYVTPPNLWFVEIHNGAAGRRTLVDSAYAVGGNAEHQPNGLMMNIDNWIYNANSNFRYQLKDGKWIKEATSFRGQWGIAKDNWGRLYYNNNTTQLIGDYVLPNTIIRNPYLKPKAAINVKLLENQKVFPLHATTVNRGYDEGILDEKGRLVNFTAACSPLIYRGGHFPDSFDENAFVCEPAANLIKRNILTFEGVRTTAKQAYEDREFVASTDEAFRPVRLLDGPDGALYVVDMHRGVLQHRADITPYYEENVVAKKLDTILGMGRIIKIKYTKRPLQKVPDFDRASAAELVKMLESPNGWVRDRAQQLLVFRKSRSVVPALKKLALDSRNGVAAVHALHVLDALDALSFDFLVKVATPSDSRMLRAHALVLLQEFASADNRGKMATTVAQLLQEQDGVTDLYLALSLGPWASESDETFLPLLLQVAERYPDKAIYQEAVISSLKELESMPVFAKSMQEENLNGSLRALLAKTIENKEEGNANPIFLKVSAPEHGRKKGYELFRTTCASCHGYGGEGIENLAPPLKGSEYVTGSVGRLAMIILKGLEGPVHVRGERYDVNAAMPAFENNLTDQQISDIISYLRNAFFLKPQAVQREINAEEIKRLREKPHGTLTEKDLLKMGT